jgi:hypothetical protein
MGDAPPTPESNPTPAQQMPEIRIHGPRRTRIREDLYRFLKDAKLSRHDFALIINSEFGLQTNEAAIRRFLNPKAARLGNDVVLAVEAYLNKHVRPEWEKTDPPPQAPPAASLFDVARAFFRMGQHKVRQYHRSVPGTYRFYAYSESDRGRQAVCLGAIRLNEDFSAEELQTSIARTGKIIREEFRGHYIYRGDSLIVMLGRKAASDAEGGEPKFYILSIPSYDDVDGQRQTLTGQLLKVGVERPVFSTTIHMVRNEAAFRETAVIPSTQIDDPDILSILDSKQWAPK